MTTRNLDFNNQEQLIEAIRFDVDYHIVAGRDHHPSDGVIDENLFKRVKSYSKKHGTLFPKGMRSRVYAIFGVRGTIENHQKFDDATNEFKRRLGAFKTKNKKRARATNPQQLVAFN